MKQALTLILGLILNNSLMAQGFPDSTTILMEKQNYPLPVIVEKPPKPEALEFHDCNMDGKPRFHGGQEALRKFISDNLR